VAHRWDLIIAEESSRLYRHHTKAGELFESAVDADIWIICPSDSVDTLDDDWPDRLHMCQMQHARSNFYTRLRMRRAHDGLWAKGAAVGNTVIGYKRRVFRKRVRGAGHPLRGTTRDRKGLFSQILVCGVCGAPMYSYGAKNGDYRCSTSAKGKCWNRAYRMRERIQPALLAAVADAVLLLDGAREKDLPVVRSRLEELSKRAGHGEKLPGPAALLRHLESVKDGLGGNEARARVILRGLLDGPIRVVPFMRVDGKKVVPRLEFKLKLVRALPPVMADALHRDGGGNGDAEAAGAAAGVARGRSRGGH
jgi:hypothetical protein